jgi:hypothetical protein
MNKFKPQDVSTRYIMKQRRVTGRVENYNWQTRIKWYPAGWKTNQISIGRRFGHLHYLACHSPAPVQKKWHTVYKQFCRQHLADGGRASMRYLNTWTCHTWL